MGVSTPTWHPHQMPLTLSLSFLPFVAAAALTSGCGWYMRLSVFVYCHRLSFCSKYILSVLSTKWSDWLSVWLCSSVQLEETRKMLDHMVPHPACPHPPSLPTQPLPTHIPTQPPVSSSYSACYSVQYYNVRNRRMAMRLDGVYVPAGLLPWC